MASKAHFGQKKNDLTFVVDGINIATEVKGVAHLGSRITLFDKSVRRSHTPPEIAAIAEAYIDSLGFGGGSLKNIMKSRNYPLTFLGLIDFYRDTTDPRIGLAEDRNTASSGKLPRELFTSDTAVCKAAHDIFLDLTRKERNTYFCLHDKSTDDVEIWYTGYHSNPFSFDTVPRFKSVALDTYGGQSKGATRVAFKVQF